MVRTTLLLILLVVSTTKCQFYYNYEEDRTDEPEAGTSDHDTSAYQYNPPSVVNEQFLQPRMSEPEHSGQLARNSRTRVRIRSSNYPPQEDYSEAPLEPEIDQQTVRQQRRQERRRQRQRIFVQPPTQPPRIYSPSVFENIGLGETPSGVYVPHDSLLNVLKNPRRAEAPAPVPQTNTYVQPPVNYVNRQPEHRFFVQPPSNEEARQPNVILTVPRSQTAVAVDSFSARRAKANRNNQHRSRPEPTVDIDSYREYTDDVSRESIPVMPQVEYTSVDARQVTPRRRTVTNYREPPPTPVSKVYSPSVFENIGLGEAPTGIYIPEDSFLNILRNPSTAGIGNRQEPRHLSEQQPVYRPEDDLQPQAEDITYEQPSPPRRRPPQRTRQPQPSASRSRGYRDEYENQPMQTSNQERRTQRRNENYEDVPREQPRASRQSSTRRRETASRSQPQVSQSEFRKAKLAIAELPSDTDDDGIPGEAGVNYPTLHEIPRTTFSCSQQSHNGYYADLETSCQVVHLCQSGGVQDSFLCPNGTIFNQEKFSCQWWYKVNCNDAPKFYVKNDELYKVPEKQRKRN